MSTFDISEFKESDKITYSLAGLINEDCKFPQSADHKVSIFVLDLDKVKMINSVGIVKWLEWMKVLPAKSKIILRKVPKVVIEQMSTVSGFIPPNTRVESFYVPYYFEETGDVKYELYVEGKDFENRKEGQPGKYKLKELKDEQTGEMGELDVLEEKYFRFLL